MRHLKFHEKKLLKKVDFYSWKSDTNVREATILKKYHIQKREDYIKYNKVAGKITKFVGKVKLLAQDDETRRSLSEHLLQKLYNMGIIDKTNSLTAIEKLPASAFCRRRLPVVILTNI
jgi:U3 small nucleolar ribonucleoprotein protein IMP3